MSAHFTTYPMQWEGKQASPKPRRVPKRKPEARCQECGRRFYSLSAANRAAFGIEGCPRCGASNIEIL